jgi:DNA invertase Pin-like site-specific DNA recombinase
MAWTATGCVSRQTRRQCFHEGRDLRSREHLQRIANLREPAPRAPSLLRCGGWIVYAEYTDEMSGAKDRRPGLDRLLLDARRARFNVVVCWALDRIGRDLKHLLAVLEDLQSLNVPFVSLKEGLDLGSASGRLQLAILAALSQFERVRLRERTVAGLERARAQGQRLGRPLEPVPVAKLESVRDISVRQGAKQLGVARSTLQRWRSLAR